MGTLGVPEGHTWVQGDNKYNSRDSRVFGAIPYGLIIGRAIWRVSILSLSFMHFALSSYTCVNWTQHGKQRFKLLKIKRAGQEQFEKGIEVGCLNSNAAAGLLGMTTSRIV
ncbi:Peptidase S26 [Dillenia turbinata]|uniref:Peptidase S26 n=1 Tax=Dillenia turbinata TaxID=194707 RepID=A0AAN8YXY5_9MAGN